ncbi:Adenylosuccinate synthetase [Rosistilla ulvae]|uniref:Adenylosuccinate synthetase n=1 Tax=Rosistilla ulvae TaxID=1930277 RepID=A0A517M501_9BACT|nr:Adenylosuccinate synthetase [Rosistilla ulvae]
MIGLQWGDEAKGKLVDLLAKDYEMVVRYAGGANAGHTVVCGDETYKLHHIPSGILHPAVQNMITPGVVINPTTLLEEIDGLAGRGVRCADNMRISERAHLVMPWHMIEDRIINEHRGVGNESIGTTNRGIGPCYRDKVGRTHAIRMTDLMQADRDERIAAVAQQKYRILEGLGASADELASIEPSKVAAVAAGWADRLRELTGDTTEPVLAACEANRKVLFEGAQGALLDIDHGTYPFVTSSNASGVGVCAGAGVPPRWINEVVGVCKAYSTRVGGGPFPTELHDDVGEQIRKLGNEYGTTTGRPRRCGWLDAVALRYTARLSGVSRLSLMMMDVLSHLDEIKICVAYEIDGKQTKHFPCHAEEVRSCKPVYETIPGWKIPVDDARRLEDLPEGAHRYIRRVEELIGFPVGIISVGPDRAQTIFTEQTKLDLAIA